MSSNAARRCPACQVLNAAGQRLCRRCLSPLGPVANTPLAAVTGETCHLYRAANGALLLLMNDSLEYAGRSVAFVTPWNNVAAIVHRAGEDLLRLYQTPRQITLPIGSSSAWFSDVTRAVPLRQFGYPANADLVADLRRRAPQLRRFLPR